VKAKEIQEEQEAVEEYRGSTAAAGKTSLGDILKEKMGNKACRFKESQKAALARPFFFLYRQSLR